MSANDAGEDRLAFIRDHISIRWHGVFDARPRPMAPHPETPPFNCRCHTERVEKYVSTPQRIILVNGPLNGQRRVVSDDRDEWRFPYDPDPGAALRWSVSAHAHAPLDGIGENTCLRYRFENREGDVTDSGELVYRFQGVG